MTQQTSGNPSNDTYNITVKKRIILYDHPVNIVYKKYKKKGYSNLEGYIKSLHDKIKPIVLTVITSIFGMLPFLLFAAKEAFWFSLSIFFKAGF